MISYRLNSDAADRPNNDSDQKNDAECLEAARIQRFLGKRRADECGEIDLLAVGIDARSVERLQRVLIAVLGKGPLALELFIRTHYPGKCFRAGSFSICHFALDRPALRLQRLDTGLQYSYRGSIVPHVVLQGR